MLNQGQTQNLENLQRSDMFESDLGEAFFLVIALDDSYDESSETEDGKAIAKI